MQWRMAMLALFLAVVGLATGFAMKFSATMVTVAVANAGPEPLRDVMVHVTGETYSLGNLETEQSRTVAVWPHSESHVEVAFTDQMGKRIRLNAGGYFEPGYQGEIAIRLERGKFAAVQHQTRLPDY